MAMILLKGRKGIFFTMAAIALAMVILFSFRAVQPKDLEDQTDVAAIRIWTMNSFIKDVEQDLEKGLYIASYRALAGMNEYIIQEDAYITDLDGMFKELVQSGTIDGDEIGPIQNHTLSNWSAKINVEAEKIGLIANFTIEDISISQSDPWYVDVEASIRILLADEKNTSSWNRTANITYNVPIQGLKDPVSIVNSNNLVTTFMNKTTISDFVQGENIDNLMRHTNQSYYIQNSDAPSFLMRLQGSLGSSPAGIERLVDVQALQDAGFAGNGRSVVDHIYFGSGSVTTYSIDGAPSWFKIDENHLELYEVEDLT